MRHLDAVETKEFVDHPFVGHPPVHWTNVQSSAAYIFQKKCKGGSLATPSMARGGQRTPGHRRGGLRNPWLLKGSIITIILFKRRSIWK